MANFKAPSQLSLKTQGGQAEEGYQVHLGDGGTLPALLLGSDDSLPSPEPGSKTTSLWGMSKRSHSPTSLFPERRNVSEQVRGVKQEHSPSAGGGRIPERCHAPHGPSSPVSGRGALRALDRSLGARTLRHTQIC